MVNTQRTLLTALAVLATLVGIHLLDEAQFGRANVVMVYMLAVVVTAALLGLWPAVLASLLGIPLFHFFDVPPYFSLDDNELQHTFSLTVMLVAAVTVSNLAGRLRQQLEESRMRVLQTAALYALSAELAADLTRAQVIDVTQRHVARAFGVNMLTGQQEAKDGGLLLVDDLAAIAARVPGGDSDKHLQAMLRLAAQALERADLRARIRTADLRAQQESLRSSILGAVSHDLRTPLASIIGASSTLLDEGEGFAPEARRQLRQIIHDEAVHMQRMVENLLDFARLRSGDVERMHEWQAIEEIAGSALAAVRRRVRDHLLVVKVPDNLPLVRCDSVLMERVLTNLLENAVKFSPPGSPVTLSAAAENGMLVLRVCDEGPGVEEALREKIFEPFFRSGGQEGSGLGLAICRGIVEGHGGSIAIDTSRGVGACFVVSLPLSTHVPVVPADEGKAS